MSQKIFVTQPSLPPLADFVKSLEKIWSNKVLTNGGEFHQLLEKSLCEYLGVKYVSLFNNGTIALLTALQALNIKGEVITTPYSFVATANSLLWNGLEPVFVDINSNTLNIDPLKIEAAITEKTSAIMPVHCYGRPCDVEAIDVIAKSNNIKVIYDAAHAFAVEVNGESVLNHGDLSVLSFHATKVFNTFEGGAIVSHTPEMKRHIDNLKNFGFVDEITVVEAGINGKMSEINAAVGLHQLRFIDAEIEKRASVAEYYKEKLSACNGIQIPIFNPDVKFNYSYYPIFIKKSFPCTRDELYEKMKLKGIFARRYFYPLITDFPMYNTMHNVKSNNFITSKTAASEVLCLPIYAALSRENLDRIIDVIQDC